MERFKIFGYTNLTGGAEDNPQKEILITSSESFSEASTFDETFKIGENDQSSLSFSIMEKLSSGEKNPFLDLIHPESVIGLQLLDRQPFTEADTDKEGAYYKFKIKERTPSFSEEKVIYSISCLGYAQAVYASQGEGLTMEKTGTLREIAEEILGETRKNNLYKQLNRDISEISYSKVPNQIQQGFRYKLPYINYKNTSMAAFQGPGIPYVSFLATDNFVHNETYDLHFDLVGLHLTSDFVETPFQVAFTVVGEQEQINYFTSEPFLTDFDGEPMGIRIPFKYKEGANLIELKIGKQIGKEWPSADEYSISLSNFKITKNKTRTTTRTSSDTALFINHLDNFKEQFSTSEGNYVSEIKMTYSVSNSNLYNALLSAAELFNAQVKFDYLDNAFFFVSNDASAYKGYQLHPDINLSSLSRPEKSTEFATILHLQGGGDIDGVIPPLPREWRMYLSNCVDSWQPGFVGPKLFDQYGVGSRYVDLIPAVAANIDPEDSKEERNNEIKKFAAHMDKIPNFESTAYDFSYFNQIGLLTDDDDSNDYTILMDKIYNTVRKINIELNINSYKYYSIYSDFSSQLIQVAFYLGAINTERTFQYNAAQKLFGDQKPDKYTSAWIGYMNSIDSSKAAAMNQEEELRLVLGLAPMDSDVETVSLEPGSFIYNALMLFGYKDPNKNGIEKLIKENQEKRNEKLEKREELLRKQEDIERQINNPSLSGFVKESLSVELAGVQKDLKDIKRYLGIPGTESIEGYAYPGIYELESIFYGELKRALNLVGSLPEEILSQEVSLHEILFDRESEHNLLNKKEKELEILMDKYEPFSLEARYENADELTAFGLLEQGLTSFTKFNRPQIQYSVSTINISALKDYKYYKQPEVGDKILLETSLYKSYEEEDTEYLVVSGYDAKLREPEAVTLTVEKDDESELLVRRMLESTNFVTIGVGKKKSNIVLPVPQELSGELYSLEDTVKDLNSADLSISNIFDDLINK